MTTHHEQHISRIPDTIGDLFVLPVQFEPADTPSVDRILHAGRDEGPVGMILSAMGELHLISSRDDAQRNIDELEEIANDIDTPVTPERRELLSAATERWATAMLVFRIAEDIYTGPDFTKQDEGNKPRVDTDKIGDLYDDTEQYEESSPVLNLLQRIKTNKETTQIDEDTRIRAERLVRIVLSG
ncbi:MAG: hypothetical protein QG628_964, partial [Patescibacteria group bacterium]|nr:hypothetical protein [Patescibacteria group bacterium]